ncbi:restriction endonuclease [Streptomyces viridosporus]|uniref:restriction endonuclease n=1 Tax=Streptomyces viridosporus TaxID=67581 RepID=UPI003701C91F
MAQFLRKQVEASGKTLTDLSKEINFSKSLISANLSGAVPKPEFLKALIGATEQSQGVRSKKMQHALTLRGAAIASPDGPAFQSSDVTGQQDATQLLIRSLQEQIVLERALRSAAQLNWALLWQMASGSPLVAAEDVDSEQGGGGEFPLSGADSDQSAGEGAPSNLVKPDPGHAPSPGVKGQRVVLHELAHAKLEAMVRNLFEAMGFAAWTDSSVTQDRGFDAVAINEDPVMGGPVLIQVKRSQRPVSVEHIRALSGVVELQKATKGVLVTTSHFTRAAHEFAARNGRIQLIDGRSLQSLFSERLGLEVDP